MEKFIDIHFEGFDRKDELVRIVQHKIPCAISIAPYSLREGGKEYGWYSVEIIDLIRQALQNKVILGQQGDIHKCRFNHVFVDPWHENSCLYHEDLMGEEQAELMKRGRETLERVFGKSPEIYIPPNHLYNFMTRLIAEEMGFKFFAERGISQRKPYQRGKIIVIPEVKIGENGEIVYIHYDEIAGKKQGYEKAMREATSFSEIKPEKVSMWEEDRNYEQVLRRKKLRDVVLFPRNLWKMVKR